MAEHKNSYKQNNWKNASTQKNSLLVADRITKRVIKLSVNVKQPTMLSSIHYPNHKPKQKSCITKAPPPIAPCNQTTKPQLTT